MKKAYRFLGLIVAVFMLIAAFTACAQTAQPTPTAAPTTAPTAAPAGAATEAPTVAPTATPQQITKMSLFINATWYWTDKWEGIIPEAITAKTGVAFDVTRAADDKQIGLMIASGDLPDMIFDGSNVSRLSNPDLCQAFQDLIPKYAPDWKVDPILARNAASFSSDGKYYTLLDATQTTASWRKAPLGAPIEPCGYYRADLLQQLGNPPLNTLDDLLAVCAMVKSKWPDMTPIVMNKDWMTAAFQVWNGVPNMNVYEADGKLSYIIDHPNYKQFCKFVNTLYRDGYITAENFAFKNANDDQPIMFSNKGFSIMYCTQVLATYNDGIKKTVPDASFVQTGNLGGTKSDYTGTSLGWAGTFITKNCKTPGPAINFVKFMFTTEGMRMGEWGREGIDYTVDANGIPTYSADFMAASKDSKVLYTKYNPSWIFGVDPVMEAVGRTVAGGITTDTPQDKELRSIVNYTSDIPLCMPKADTDESVILNKLDNLRSTQTVKIFLSASDDEFEKNYQELLDDAKTIGIDQLNTFLTDNFTKLNSSK